MDFWVWVAILIIAWLLEALASAKKKKRRPPPPPPPPPPPAPPRPPSSLRPRPRVERPSALRPAGQQVPPRKVYLPGPVAEPSASGEALVFEVPVARAPRPREPEVAASLEGLSAEAETVEVAGESTDAEHTRVLEKYAAAPAAGSAPPPRRRLVLRPANLREAVLWSEILGRPKGGW